MQITFTLKDGTNTTVECRRGQTVLSVAEENKIPLHSNCEGFGVCGSCHVIAENLHDRLPQISDKENDALDKVASITPNSRLACQLILDEDLNGLKVRIP